MIPEAEIEFAINKDGSETLVVRLDQQTIIEIIQDESGDSIWRVMVDVKMSDGSVIQHDRTAIQSVESFKKAAHKAGVVLS